MKRSILVLAAALGALALLLPLAINAQRAAQHAAQPASPLQFPTPEPGPPPPTCDGQTATIYVNAQNIIVGGPKNGQPYRGKLSGTPGNDVMVGTSGKDEIAARGGNDVICALEGKDEIEAGAGNDTMTGGAGADQFKGGAGTDTATDFSSAEGDTKRGVEQTTPPPSGADISLSANPGSGTETEVTVSNAGPLAATVSVYLECPSFGGAIIGTDPSFWNVQPGPPGELVVTSVNPIPSGESLSFTADCDPLGPGFAEVASSTETDPDSTPNNAVTTEDDYVVVP